jgi:hypothetical protein
LGQLSQGMGQVVLHCGPLTVEQMLIVSNHHRSPRRRPATGKSSSRVKLLISDAMHGTCGSTVGIDTSGREHEDVR